jgi:hypothetical protein
MKHGAITEIPELGGLHHRYERIANLRLDAFMANGRFSLAMVWMAVRISKAVNGLPTSLLRERRRQYKRKPFRCQRTTVPGFTIRSALDLFGDSLRSVTQNTRSKWRKRARLVQRFKTITCCLKGFQAPAHDATE